MKRAGVFVLLVVLLVACGGQGPATQDPPGSTPEDPPGAPTGVITGALTDSAGAPLSGAEVTLGEAGALPASTAGVEPAAATRTTTNAAGQFAFDVAAEGEYTLTTIVGDEGAFTRVTVTRGADGKLVSKPLEMQAAPLGGVAGSVAGRGAGVWAVLLGTSFLAATDADGEFVISRVPAGDYRLAASLLGATGSSVAVRVRSGEITQVTTPLQLGPVITKVEPETVIFYEWPLPDSHNELEVQGSGFGAEVGTSVVRYAGQDVTSAVRSWSDTSIVLDLERLTDRLEWDDIAVAQAALSLATPAGTASSAPVGYYEASITTPGHYLSCGGLDWANDKYLLYATMVGRLQLEGVTFTLEAQNGVVSDPVSGEPVAHVTTGAEGCALFDLEREPGTALPVLVTAQATAPANFEQHELEPLVVHAPQLTVKADDLVPALEAVLPGATVLRGSVSDPELGRYADDDGNYAVGVRFCNLEDHDEYAWSTIALDEGNFELELEVPADARCLDVALTYRGHQVAWDTLGVVAWPATTPLTMGETATVEFDFDEPGALRGHLFRAAPGDVDGDMIRIVVDAPYGLGYSPYRVAVLDTDLKLRYWTENKASYLYDGWFYTAQGGTPTAPLAAFGGALAPQAIDHDAETCEVVCIQFEPFGDFYVLVDSRNGWGTVEVEAIAATFADLTEPQNDDPLTAPVLDFPYDYEIWNTDSGAIETVGDVDYWKVVHDVHLNVFSNTYLWDGPTVEAHLIDSHGNERLVEPKTDQPAYAGEVLRVRGISPEVAGVWRVSQYSIDYMRSEYHE